MRRFRKDQSIETIEKSKSVLKEFRSFALRANAIDLAIGVTIGSAFTAVVTSIVQGLFTPLISAIAGNSNFSGLALHLNGSALKYGQVINAVVSLVIIAAVMFFVVVKPLNALRRNLGYDAQDVTKKSKCPACRSEIPVEATRCAFCTEQLGTDWSVADET